MLNKLISAVKWLLSQNWRMIYDYTHVAAVAIGNIMGSKFVVEKAEQINDLLNQILKCVPEEQKAVVAAELTKENKLIPDIDVKWDEKKGFQVGAKLSF